MIDRSFVEKIESMAEAKVLEVDNLKYSSQNLFPLTRPLAPRLELSTLAGVAAYLQHNDDGVSALQTMLVVHGEDSVSLIGPLMDPERQRDLFVMATAERPALNLGTFLPREEFHVKLMSMFVQTEQRDMLLRYVANIVQKAEVETADDGISQRVTAKTGIARVGKIDLPNPISLRPYRTFPEVEQPESSFIFRIKQTHDGTDTAMALFEADGGMWKLEAAANIKKWLEDHIEDARVVV